MMEKYLIILLLLMVILGFIYLFYATGILKRRVLVTTIKNLPIGIFKENTAQVQEETIETHVEENSDIDENKLITCNNENVENKSENDLKKEFSSQTLGIVQEHNIQNEEIVYWTPQGKHYHKIKNCGTLLRSKVINSGSIDKSGKLSGCNKCNKL